MDRFWPLHGVKLRQASKTNCCVYLRAFPWGSYGGSCSGYLAFLRLMLFVNLILCIPGTGGHHYS